MTPEQRAALRSTVADLIGRTVDNWNGYNRQRPALFAEIASRLESAGLLQSPESAAELESRTARYRTAWRRARTRALSMGGAADRSAARAAEMHVALLDAVGLLLTVQMERNAARARVTTLEAAADAARAVHSKYAESEHCQQDGEPWPCSTVAALSTGAGEVR